MDWTAVYDENGEEDFLIPQLMKEHKTEPRLARLASFVAAHQQQQQQDDDDDDDIIDDGNYFVGDDDDHNVLFVAETSAISTAVPASIITAGISRGGTAFADTMEEGDNDDVGQHRFFDLIERIENSNDNQQQRHQKPASNNTAIKPNQDHRARPLSYHSCSTNKSKSNSSLNFQQWQQNNSKQQPSNGYNLTALYFLCINYILGVGCLGIPYAFARAGFVLAASLVCAVSILSYCTVLWVAQTGARVELQQHGQEQQSKPSPVQQPPVSDSSLLSFTTRHHPPPPGGHEEQQRLLTTPAHPPPTQSFPVTRYEMVDLVSHFLGPVHKLLYQVSLLGLMYVGLLAYAQVFCGAVATLLFSSSSSSHPSGGGLPQLLFAFLVVPLSCVELDEQLSIQSFMAYLRFVAMFVMIAGSILALLLDDDGAERHNLFFFVESSDKYINVEEAGDGMVRRRLLQLLLPKHPPYFAPSEPEGCRMSYGICVGGFGIAFSTALFSQLFQHSVPGLLRPLKLQQQQQRRRSSKSNRRNSKSADHRPSDYSQHCANNVLNGVPRIFSLALGTTCALYLLLGVSAASFFGSGTRPSVNLCYVLLPPSLLGRTRCVPCACRVNCLSAMLMFAAKKATFF